MATYAELSQNERMDYHRKRVELNRTLERLNQLYNIARTPEEKQALRTIGAPLAQQEAALSYDDFLGTNPDE